MLPEAARQRPWRADLQADGWQVCFLPDKASLARSAWELAQVVSREGGIILHTHFSAYDVIAWLASRLLQMRGKKVGVVWHAHSDFQVRNTPCATGQELSEVPAHGQKCPDHCRVRQYPARTP